CANCPTIVKIIQFKYPELKDNIINVSSPMTIMSRFVKKEYGSDYKTVFVGPCLAKKLEAKEFGIDYAITFKELQDIFNYYEENKLPYKEKFDYPMTTAGDPDFDKFYNDYTKIYPLPGAVAKTMDLKGILKIDQILILDGPKNIDEGIQKFKRDLNIKFLDMLSCEGGCVGGPGIINKESLENRTQKVLDYKKYCKKDKIGTKLGKFQYSNGLDLKR
ncbi:MAG: [Fe-Fe] hydrogenase large subunit C-terminal domain-containing protein, partial [Candidatus Absconditabacterales bacterium]